MKQLFGFVMLIAVALLLLTVISGIGGVFSSIAATWTVDQTAQIASGLSEVLWLGGIVTVMTLGYGLFVSMSKGGKGWGGGRQAQPTADNQYYVLDQPQQPVGMIGMNQDNTQWYDFDEMSRNHSESVQR